MSFSRTPQAIAAEYLFWKDEVLVYVEGHTDIPFYRIVLDSYNCRIRTYSEKEGFNKLVDGLIKEDLHYVIILDGHYEILTRKRSQHRRLILLHRHSYENYLIEEEPIEQFRFSRAKLDDSLEELPSSFDEILIETEQRFKELLILDIANQNAKTGFKVFPKGAERFFLDQKVANFNVSKIQDLSIEASQQTNRQTVESARSLVQDYLKEHRFIDILPGHFAVSIIRRWINHTINVRKKVSDEEIRVYLSSEVWRIVKSRDHDSLKRRLHSAVREAEQKRQVFNS